MGRPSVLWSAPSWRLASAQAVQKPRITRTRLFLDNHRPCVLWCLGGPSNPTSSALNRLPLTDLASDAPPGVGAAVCAVGAPTGKSGRPIEQSRPAFGLGGASEREREDLHPSTRSSVDEAFASPTGSGRSPEPNRGSVDRRLRAACASMARRVAASRWEGVSLASERRGASPALGRGVAATRRASGACSMPNRARSVRSTSSGFSSALGRREPCQRSGAAHGSLTSREFVYPTPPATTLKGVTTPAGESTAVNGRGGIAQKKAWKAVDGARLKGRLGVVLWTPVGGCG